MVELNTDSLAGASYDWIGPNGFTATGAKVLISSASLSDQGNYQVRATINTCISAYSLPVELRVKPIPEKPVAENDGPICVGKGSDILTLSVSEDSYVANYQYSWTEVSTGNRVAGPTSEQHSALIDFSQYSDGDWSFQLTAVLDGCASEGSEPSTVSMSFLPDEQARAGDDIRLCDSSVVLLQASSPLVGVGEWKSLDELGVVVDDQANAVTLVSNLASDTSYLFEWILNQGVCIAYDRDTLEVFVNSSSQEAFSDPIIDLCGSTSISLNSIEPNGAVVGRWTQSLEQASEGVMIEDPADPQTFVNGIVSGNSYFFRWILSNEGCGDYDSALTKVQNSDPEFQALAGDDEQICGEPSTFLSALVQGGIWSSLDPELEIVEPENAETRVNGLKKGNNVFVLTVQNGACGESSDEVIIKFDNPPELADDRTELTFNPEVVVKVIENDVLPNEFLLTLHTQPSRGSVRLENNEFTYKPDPDFVGIDQFSYRVCNADCPDKCEIAIVSIDVDNQFTCGVPSIFTPNNDGVNDEFKIPCLAPGGRFPNNSVSIFNQWGDEVLSQSPYQNNWRGTFEGDNLPTGTYFYVVDFGDGSKPESGFLVLER